MTRTLRSIGRQHLQAAALGAAAMLALFGARSAQAQWGRNGQQNAQLLFEWQGNVDRETQFTIGSRGVDVRGTQSNESRGRFVSRGSLPRNASGTLYVERVSGRGRVDVIQQPGYNSGDGVVRIQDPSGGQGYYDIRVYWEPSGTYSSGNGGYGYPNGGYDRGRDGVYERNGEVGRGRNNDVAYDRNGNVLRDRRGNVVYERHGNQVLVRDRNGNAVFDRNGNPVYAKTNNGRWGRGRD
jgi:hypothetical protein